MAMLLITRGYRVTYQTTSWNNNHSSCYRGYVRFHRVTTRSFHPRGASSCTFSICAMFGDPRGFQGSQKKNMEPPQMVGLCILKYKHMRLSCSVLRKCGIILSYRHTGRGVEKKHVWYYSPVYIDYTYQICTKRPEKIGSASCQYFRMLHEKGSYQKDSPS